MDSFDQVTVFNAEMLLLYFLHLASKHSFPLFRSDLLQVSEHLRLSDIWLFILEPGSPGRDCLMKLRTSVCNKVSEQKACEVLGKKRERREQETAALSLVEQLEPKPFIGEVSAPGTCFAHSWVCAGSAARAGVSSPPGEKQSVGSVGDANIGS